MSDAGRPYLILPPDPEVVTADEVRTLLGLGSTEPSTEMLDAMIAGVVGTLDAERGWLGRAIGPQVWELRLGAFPPCGEAIRLPYPPCQIVESVEYDDANGDEQTLVEGTDYVVIGVEGHNRALVKPIATSWPAASSAAESVRITYTAGYSDLPGEIKSAIALGVRHMMSVGAKDLHLARDEVPGVLVHQYVVSEAASKAIETAIGSLLGTFRVYG